VKISTNLQTVSSVGPPLAANINQIAVANGHVYVAANALNTTFVTKLVPSGKHRHSTYSGQRKHTATAMAVDPSGNVYVNRHHRVEGFSDHRGAYCPAVHASGRTADDDVEFRLQAQSGWITRYSTYLTDGLSTPGWGDRRDTAGDASSRGTTQGNLATTPGAITDVLGDACQLRWRDFLPHRGGYHAFLAKLDSAGATLVFSTYIGSQKRSRPGAVALAPDGTIFLSGYRGPALLSCHQGNMLSNRLETQPCTHECDRPLAARDGYGGRSSHGHRTGPMETFTSLAVSRSPRHFREPPARLNPLRPGASFAVPKQRRVRLHHQIRSQLQGARFDAAGWRLWRSAQ